MYIQQSTRTLRYSLSNNHPQWQPRVVLSLPHVIEIVNKMLKKCHCDHGPNAYYFWMIIWIGGETCCVVFCWRRTETTSAL